MNLASKSIEDETPEAGLTFPISKLPDPDVVVLPCNECIEEPLLRIDAKFCIGDFFGVF